ncbi:MAG: AAA family ATPase [Candidatus Staskawiczbacteria bacterium RIFOXYB2_FULL_32_9]|uniref:AAA family ATPase n=1 Tax=Candidatus Staskawiczbacteria bacterium RIFOXYD1_FULL_32_13 TaxID=1802234 RepID=A0A1G2JKU3_9BACT|nr:MAG: AAA family ATPase [Candidatus Staskawiczbacteria bacterium RIFOXYB1_FULL_32_11]OGZ79512.1 MAG: AAA family ATPase [Candidatus Staskawiczbacteria bacterium RIFOXYA2_FULL_32_7]OGZ81179.1 MAG: AAA family ATPase [Candidatus Staskawiczbacteria bacterium RIFOXYB2_FULL_32_9]OGZ87579.1 MAG: AAA family ATPase [Candidatus Staskawiczbacteria bacterium RIFOXYC2_FULL_32_10]OGZ87767.1 MAG: AAA family ATPase [Candidatus Staskawiczbacteria bacterium RIFOXYD1_FULL_32_13]
MEKKPIEINSDFKRALNIIENSNNNVFITGKAGTGKSTLLDYFRSTTKKQIAVLAPTGVASINVRGQTIHSFFGFKPDITIEKAKNLARKVKDKKLELYKRISAIVIDEVSMVRADLLDCVDAYLKTCLKNKLPFGGKQMILIGDLYQLPPVLGYREERAFLSKYESPYFFSAKIFDDLVLEFVELEKVYRQKDEKFIKLLNAVRNRSVTDNDLAEFNKRLNVNFEPSLDDFYICLTPMNDSAREINEKKLKQLNTKEHFYEGKIFGDFDKNYLPTDKDLSVKIGSQIMLLNNDKHARWVNGTVAKIVDVEENVGDYGEPAIIVELDNGSIEEILPYTWEIFHYDYDPNSRSLQTKVIGSFTQYPLKLAWAVTIHKSQGKTFDKVIIDMGRGAFAHGQTYVALSRCTCLEGIVLKKPIIKNHIFLDWRVIKFLTKFQYKIGDNEQSQDEKIELIAKAIKEKSELEIIYLKANDEKSKRIIQPKIMGQMQYMGVEYLGVSAFCLTRREDRTFRVDRILSVKHIESTPKK